MAAATRGSSGRQAVPRHAERSHEAGVQQSHGISCDAAMSISSPQGMSGMVAAVGAVGAVAASRKASSAACAGATSVVTIIVMISNQCSAKWDSDRNDMAGF